MNSIFINKVPVVVLVFSLFLPAFTFAFAPIINQPAIPYEVLTIDAQIEQERLYLGELTNDPHTYEFAIGETKPLVLSLMQLEGVKEVPFSLIIVEVNENNRGVTEVGRLDGREIVWESSRNHALGLMMSSGKVFTTELTPGVYRFEVSSADNKGKYLLNIGTVADKVGYFSKLKNIYTVRQFLGAPIFGMLFSSAVYYPLGIILLIGLVFLTWFYRGRIEKWRHYE
jgi:hypothetical protein